MKLIDVEPILKKLEETKQFLLHASCDNDTIFFMLYLNLNKLIRNAPVIEPKQGKWSEIENDVCYRQICSKCKKRIKVCIEDCGGENNVYGQSKFCPNCGVKMNGAEHD